MTSPSNQPDTTPTALPVGRGWPVVTPVVFVVTLLCGVAQLVHRPLYEYVVRDPDRIGDGQWYRLLTGMFFQDGWASGLVSNLVLLALFGTLAERVFGRWRWIVLYFGCGWIGQLVSYLWLNPRGAGNSMCVAGLVGGLAMFLLLSKRRYGVKLPPQLLLFAVVVPVLSVVGTVLHDNHGIPALLGMLLVYLLPKPRASAFTA